MGDLPRIGGGLAVRILADEMADRFCLIRTEISPAVDVAVVYDGSDRGFGEAEGYARLLSGAPAMLGLLERVLARWGAVVADDVPIDGGDAVAWLSEFTIDMRDTLQVMVAPFLQRQML